MNMPGSYSLLRQGKVRDVYLADDDRHLLLVASDRISAFDHVLPNPIPNKGAMLTQLSNFWFSQTEDSQGPGLGHVVRARRADALQLRHLGQP